MQSNNKSRDHPTRKRKGKKGAEKPLSLNSAAFRDKVTRLDKLMQLAVAPTPKAPPGFTLMKDERGGTLEQVGREADNAWAGVKRIMELLNVEEKYVDFDSSVNVNYTGFLLDLGSSITQGVGRGQRTGDSIKLTRLLIRYTVTTNGVPTDVQVVLGHSKDALPALGDLFALSGATSVNAGLSHDNWYESKANPVKRRDIMTLVQGASGTGNLAIGMRDYEEKMEHHIVYSAASATTLSGATWLAAISGVNSGLPVLKYSIRVFFVDN